MTTHPHQIGQSGGVHNDRFAEVLVVTETTYLIPMVDDTTMTTSKGNTSDDQSREWFGAGNINQRNADRDSYLLHGSISVMSYKIMIDNITIARTEATLTQTQRATAAHEQGTSTIAKPAGGISTHRSSWAVRTQNARSGLLTKSASVRGCDQTAILSDPIRPAVE